MLSVIGASSGASWVLADWGARWLAGDAVPRAHVAILAKDLDLALALAAGLASADGSLPLAPAR
jgi:3-hydroxyisobutyrate dehydrogenase